MWWACGPTIQFLFFLCGHYSEAGGLKTASWGMPGGDWGNIAEVLRQFCAEVGEKALTFTLRSFTIPRL